MIRLKRLLALAPLLLAAKIAAADVVRVEVAVTWVSGDGVYLDQGREAGLEIGDLVAIDTATGGRVQARLVAVAKSTSRATVIGPGTVRTGDRGEILVPADRRATVPAEPAEPAEPAKAEGGEKPDHPPWTRELEERDADTPLLAPAFSLSRAERPVRWRGRIYTNFFASRDREGDRNADFALFRLGEDIQVENLFGRGGILEIASAVDSRTADIEDGPSDTNTVFRIDLLSYRWGVGIDSPLEVRVGRFIPRDLPEIGLVDGAEASFLVGNIGRFALNVGALPEPFPDRVSYKDFGVTLSWRSPEEAGRTVDLGAAFQQTWHKGDFDRTLFIGKVFWRPSMKVNFDGAAWVDLYNSDDVVKGPGAELTEFHLRGTWRPAPGTGFRAGISHIKWPEMERYEFPPVTVEQLADNRVTRLDLSTFHDFSRTIRGDLRVGFWQDQDDDGITGRASVRFRDLLWNGGDFTLGAFRLDGTQTEGYGGRIGFRQSLPTADLRLGYEISSLNAETYSGDGDTLLRQAIIAGVDWFPDRHWTVSLTGDVRFGDFEDEMSIGILAQYRF